MLSRVSIFSAPEEARATRKEDKGERQEYSEGASQSNEMRRLRNLKSRLTILYPSALFFCCFFSIVKNRITM